jgi:threonine/homoserine/homoserine lactone efflux protein
MPSAETLVAFGVASLLLAVVPGPAVLYIVNRSVADGRRIGLAAVAGVASGTFVHVVAAAVGLSAVLAASATAFNVVKWIGVAYLLWVGVTTLLTRAGRDVEFVGPTMSGRRAYAQGMLTNIFNPKVALFFLSFLPQFIDPDQSGWLQSLILGLEFTALSLLSDSTYSLLASGLRGALMRGRAVPFVRRYVSGTVFVGLGVVAATSRRAAART